LPGNAALAMPLRWSHGTMQIFVDPPLLPPSFVGQTITGIRMRRATLFGDVAYPSLQRTLTVRGGFQAATAAQMIGSLTQNRPANTLVLFGPATVTVAATPAPGPSTIVGDEFLQIAFAVPLPVVPGSLFLEFEAMDAPLQFSAGHWVDAVWFEDGADTGLAVTVGDGSCTTRNEPTHLAWDGPSGPMAGTATQFEISGLPPSIGAPATAVLAWVGIDPETRPAGPGYLGFGGGLQLLDPALAGCHQWAPFDVAWTGVPDALGRLATGFPLPGTAAIGVRLAVQSAWLDANRAGALPFSFSNGVMLVLGSVGVGNRCATMFFPAGTQISPWPSFKGQMPVLVLQH
jgi:hypothetical protein